MSIDPKVVAAVLSRGGFLAADDEAEQLVAHARGRPDVLQASLNRRLTGEPLAWITGSVVFCGLEIRISPGVYVPRAHTEKLVERAVARLARDGVGVDLCTGSGAVARVMRTRRPRARVIAGDVDERAVACARGNGVEAFRGDLFEAIPRDLEGEIDVLTAVAPYVPTAEMQYLQRDTFAFESPLAYDGGIEGVDLLRRVVAGSTAFLKPGGALLLELGGDQATMLRDDMTRRGFADVRIMVDEDGDPRGVEATLVSDSRLN